MTTTHYKYNPFRNLTQVELNVISKGYSGEKLHTHRYSSDNNHEIIRGSLKAHKVGLRSIFRFVLDAINMPANVDYEGTAGPDGCTFVEGNEVFSPNTAQRFEARATIVQFPEGTLGAFPVTG